MNELDNTILQEVIIKKRLYDFTFLPKINVASKN